MIDPIKLCMGCMEEPSSEPVCPRCGYREGEPESPLHLRPRTELHGQYLVGRVLGEGPFGLTYLAWDLHLARKTLVKEYLPRTLASRTGASLEVTPFQETRKDFEWGLERFLDEALSLSRFQTHPAMLAVVNFLRANGTAYMVTEFLEGATMARFLELQGGRTTIENVLLIMNPVLEALSAVHQAGILHRDIRPENIFITRTKQMKVKNFAGARYALACRTNSLIPVLKDGFAPVELYDPKGNQGPWTDGYQCAATMYLALTGRLPAPALERRRLDELVSPVEMGAAIATHQQQAILKALAVRPEDRFLTLKAFQEALAGMGAPTGPPPAATPLFRESVPFRDFTDPPRPATQPPKPVSTLPPPSKVPPPAPAPRTAPPQPASPASEKKAGFPIWAYAALAAAIAVAGYMVWDWMSQRERQAAQQEARRKQIVEPRPSVDTVSIPAPDPSQPPPEQTTPTQTSPQQPAPQTSPQTRQTPAPKTQQELAAKVKARPKRSAEAAAKPATYEDFMMQGHAAARNRDNQAALDNYLKAASLEPDRPQAFANAGWIYLYSLADYPNVLSNYRRALQLGGMVQFRVQHDHGDLTFAQACSGDFGFSRERVAYKDDHGAHSFNVPREQVQQIQQNKASTGQLFGDFRIRLADGRTFNFISYTKPKPIGDLILQLFH